MRIDIITVLPEMLEGFVHESILARAEKKGFSRNTFVITFAITVKISGVV